MGALLHQGYGPALQAAQSAAGAQHYPQGCLYVLATPIGNGSDAHVACDQPLDARADRPIEAPASLSRSRRFNDMAISAAA